MLDLFFIIFCCLSVLGIKIKENDNFFSDYMELDDTNCIKGVFVWLIIFCHKTGYGKKKYKYIQITHNLGQNVVSMFLFYSSFGICESIKRKGIDYVQSLRNKAIILFLKTQIIILMFLIANIFILNKKITIKSYILSIIFKLSLGKELLLLPFFAFYMQNMFLFIIIQKNFMQLILFYVSLLDSIFH